MKTKLRRLSKRSLALFLGIMMLLTAIGTSVVFAFQRQDFTYVHFVGDDLSGSGLDTAYFTSSDGQNHYTGTWYVKNKNSDYANYEYNYYVKVHGKVKQNDSWEYYLSMNNTVFGTGTGEHNGSSDDDCVAIYEGNGNMTLKVMPTSSGWVALQVNFWGDYNSNARLGLYQSAVSSVSYSPSPASNTLYPGGTTTISQDASGGTGSYSYTFSVKDSSNNTVNCMSGNTFTAPYVTEPTTYTVTATATDSNISALSKTSTTNITVNPSDFYVSGLVSYDGNTCSNTNKMFSNGDGSYSFVANLETYSSGSEGNTDGKFAIKVKTGTSASPDYATAGPTADDDFQITSAYISQDITISGTVKYFLFKATSGAYRITFTPSGFKTGTLRIEPAGYYVVSGSKSLTGNSWDVDDPLGQMSETATSGIYEKVFKGVNPGTYNFRISQGAEDANYLTASSLNVSGTGVTPTTNGNNVSFTITSKSRVTITYDKALTNSKHNVTITVNDAIYVPVKLYANGGGGASITYGGLTRSVDEGENVTVDVLEGDTVDLSATADTGFTFSKWQKGLTDDYSTTASITETINSGITYIASFTSAGGGSGDWLYSGTDAASRTAVTPTSGMSAFDTSTTGTDEHGAFRFMYGSGDTSLTGILAPSYYGSDSNSKHYWAELTSSMTGIDHFYFGLCNYSNKGNLVGNNSEEANDTTSNKTILDTSGNTLFKIEIKQNNNVSNRAKYMLVYNVDWTKVSAIGVKAFDNSNATNGSNGHGGRVDYQFYYKAVGGGSSGSTTVVDYEPEVNYFAKDGTIRIYTSSFAQYATTTVTAVTDVVTAGTRKNYVDNGTAAESDTVENSETTGTTRLRKETWLEGKATKGQNITVTTTIDNTTVNGHNLRNYYYVAGFSFNGVTPELLEWNADGVYTSTYKIPEDVQYNKLEITPIFFLKDSTNTVTFYIDGYAGDVVNNWGHTLYVYPFYQYYKNGVSGTKTTYFGQAENYLGYPGQPVINYGGQRYAQIPLTDNGNAIGTSGSYRVKGVTINNGYWDQIHGDTSGSGDGHDNKGNLGANFVSTHYQTYDFDDFYKIFNEHKAKGSKNLNSIKFTFKYKTGSNHRTSVTDGSSGDQRMDDTTTPITTSSYTGWEDLTDNYKRKVDIFGTVLSSAQASNTTSDVLIVSQGYEANNAGKFGTEWAIFQNNGSGSYVKKTVTNGNVNTIGETSIVPSALVINKADDVGDTDYPGLDGDGAVKSYKAIYQALESLRGKPARITYESDIHGGGKKNSDNSNGYDPAYRCDGRWTFTRTTDYITSNVKIQYQAKNSNTWTDDAFTSGTSTGSTTKTKAYFTYESASKNGYGAVSDGETSITSLVQDDKFYSLKAEAAGNYEFAGWYYEDVNGELHEVNAANITSTTAESPMSGSNTYIARFKYVTSGSLSISHSLASGNTNRGTTYLGVSVGGTELVNEYTNKDAYTLDKSIVKSSNSATEVVVTLRTVPSGENTFSSFSGTKTNTSDVTSDASANTDSTFGNATNTTEDGATLKTITFTIGDLFSGDDLVYTALDYYSALTAPINKYEIKYTYNGRAGDSKSYTVKGTFEQSEVKAYLSGSGTSKTVSTDFLTLKIPHVSNFKKNITWNTSTPTFKTDDGYSAQGWKKTNDATNEYTFKASINSSSNDDVSRHAIFSVPYEVQSQENCYDPVTTNSKVAKADENNTFEIDTVYGKWFDPITTCTSSTTLDGSNNFVTAPTMIYETVTENNVETEVPYYFSYWKVSALTASGKAGKFVTNVYYHTFYYTAYDNYFIEAVYDTDPNNASGKIYSTNNGKSLDSSITYLKGTRNEWNEDGHGNDTGFSANKIWNDFAVTYKYDANTLNDYTEKDVRVGMVVERVGRASMDGSVHVGSIGGYETLYSDTLEGSRELIADALAANPDVANFSTSTYNGTNRGGAYYAANLPYADNYNGAAPFDMSDTRYVDNKNRCEIGYALYDKFQSNSGDAVTTYANKTYVFRAFSYIMVKTGNTWEVSVCEDPAYFCMYDVATQ